MKKKTVLADKQYLAIYNYWLKNEYPDKILRFFKIKNERKSRKKKNFRSIVMKDKRFKVVKGVVNKKEGLYLYKNWNYSSNKNQISDDKVEQNKLKQSIWRLASNSLFIWNKWYHISGTYFCWISFKHSKKNTWRN